MMTPEVLREIRREVRNQLSVILNAKLGESTTEDQEIIEPVPGGPTMAKRPVVHPYGLVSRAPQGKLGVTGRVGEHPGARVILGVRDVNRADIELEEGELCLYDETGNKIFLKKEKVTIDAEKDVLIKSKNTIKLGDDSSDEPAVLGKVLLELLGKIIDEFVTCQFGLTTSPGNLTAPNPALVAKANLWKTQYISTTSTDILSQETFVRRKP
jgi:phage gp45-like